MINKKKIGNDTEKKALELLSDLGYRCHLFSYNSNGQPCDVVAMKNDRAFLIDVKHCSENRFEFKNIQPNQRTCFEYAEQCGNTKCGFMIFFERYNVWRWLSYERLCKFDSYDFKSVRIQDCEELPYETNC